MATPWDESAQELIDELKETELTEILKNREPEEFIPLLDRNGLTDDSWRKVFLQVVQTQGDEEGECCERWFLLDKQKNIIDEGEFCEENSAENMRVKSNS